MESLFLTSNEINFHFDFTEMSTDSFFSSSLESYIFPLKTEKLASEFQQEIPYQTDFCRSFSNVPELTSSIHNYGKLPYSSYLFISDDYKYDDDFEFDDFDDDFDDDFEELPDDDFEDFPDPYADEESEDEEITEDEVEIDPFDDFDDLEADENTFVSDDEDVDDI